MQLTKVLAIKSMGAMGKLGGAAVSLPGPPSVRQVTTSPTGTVTLPAGAVEGDVFVVYWAGGFYADDPTPANIPAGWTLVTSARYDRAQSAVYVKAFAEGDAAASVVFPGGTAAAITAMAIENALITDLFEVSPTTSGSAGNTRNHYLGAVNTSQANCLIIGGVTGGWGGGFTYTPPAGFTEQSDFAATGSGLDGCVTSVATLGLAPAGDNLGNFTNTTSLHFSGHLMAIKNHS